VNARDTVVFQRISGGWMYECTRDEKTYRGSDYDPAQGTTQPAQKIAKTGKPFMVAKVRAHAGDADVFVNVIAFGQAACDALLALGDGDAVALAGSLTPKAWTNREGMARPALDLVASQVLSAYQVTRKRRAIERKPTDPPEPRPASRHDELDGGSALDFSSRTGFFERFRTASRSTRSLELRVEIFM
jgi:single-stranded DNA-binding protein